MSRKNIADVLAEEAEHAEEHRDDEPLAAGHRRAQLPREPAQLHSLWLEDIAMLRAVHGGVVLHPCDGNSTARLVAAMADRDGIS
jgi:hypothetical protein